VEEPLVVQHGLSPVRPTRAHCIEFLPFEQVGDYMRRARVVVAHAGVGTFLTARASGKHPLVVPRLARFGEAVDDHQLAFAQRLHEAGLATLVEDPAQLADALAGEPEPMQRAADASGGLARELRAYVAAEIARR
jgi:UDP-N-acetylglucosamine transferase subunit ALG13